MTLRPFSVPASTFLLDIIYFHAFYIFQTSSLAIAETYCCDSVLRELDLRILQEALSREAEEEREEAAAKAKRMEDMKFYREQLTVMMAQVRIMHCCKICLIIRMPHYYIRYIYHWELVI